MKRSNYIQEAPGERERDLGAMFYQRVRRSPAVYAVKQPHTMEVEKRSKETIWKIGGGKIKVNTRYDR